MNNAPWTDLGRLESLINEIKQSLHRKVEFHDLHEIARRVDSLEHTVREMGTVVDGFRYRIEAIEKDEVTP